jgi:hypothetical protein
MEAGAKINHTTKPLINSQVKVFDSIVKMLLADQQTLLCLTPVDILRI